jgi:universal stress protein A
MTHWRAICCAVDFSEASRTALEEAATLADRLGARLTLVHVSNRRAALNPEPLFAPPPRRARGHEAYELAAWVQEAEQRLPGRVSSILLSGGAGAEIARLVREFEFDLVVLGTRRRTGMTRLVSGSVADEVMSAVHCPVLIVQTGNAESERMPAGKTRWTSRNRSAHR